MPHSMPLHRRAFLIRAGGWAAVTAGAGVLAGCGGGGEAADVPVTSTAPVVVVPAAVAAVPTTDAQRLNFALNLHYLAAQFHGYAATGAGLPAALLGGTGRQGAVSGGRAATLADPIVIGMAADLANDKQAQVAALRTQLGAAAAAMPAIDLSAGTSGPFALAVKTAGGGAALDPFAGDTSYLLGAFVLEYALAATQRSLAMQMTGTDASAAIAGVLAQSIHHGALVRTALDIRAADDPTATAQVGALCAALAAIDGSTAGDGMLADADSAGTNLADADGHPLPFTRDPSQALRLAFVDPRGTIGGFLPMGLNGLS